MELSLIVVLVVGAVLIWAGYQVFFAKKKTVTEEPVAPYKLEPRTQIDSEVKAPVTVETKTDSEDKFNWPTSTKPVVEETKPELKVVNGAKPKTAAKNPDTTKPKTTGQKRATKPRSTKPRAKTTTQK